MHIMKSINFQSGAKNLSSAFKIEQNADEVDSKLLIQSPDGSPLQVGYTEDAITVTHDKMTIEIPSEYPIVPMLDDQGYAKDAISQGEDCNGVIVSTSKYDDSLSVGLLYGSPDDGLLIHSDGFGYRQAEGWIYPHS